MNQSIAQLEFKALLTSIMFSAQDDFIDNQRLINMGVAFRPYFNPLTFDVMLVIEGKSPPNTAYEPAHNGVVRGCVSVTEYLSVIMPNIVKLMGAK